jgi:hypothetical protein
MRPTKDIPHEAGGKLSEGCAMDEVLDRVDLVEQAAEGVGDGEADGERTTEELLRQIDEWGE